MGSLMLDLDDLDFDDAPRLIDDLTYADALDILDDMGVGVSWGGWSVDATASRLVAEAAARGIEPNILREHAGDRMAMAVASMELADLDPYFVAPTAAREPARKIDRWRPTTNSPIEERLLLAIEGALGHVVECWGGYCTFGRWVIETQLPVLGYRLDIAIRSLGDDKIAVEADGHAYHERTKEQAAHDRRRDRRLTADGWHVLRFTGSEIHRDAEACAFEVVDLMDKLDAGRRS